MSMPRPYDSDDANDLETAPFIRALDLYPPPRKAHPSIRKHFGRLCVVIVSLSSLLLALAILTLVSSLHQDAWYTVLPFFSRPASQQAIFDSQGNLIRHPHYLVFSLNETASRPALVDRPLRGVRRLPSSCIEDHIAYGSPCRDGRPVKFDMVWTWVNGSDKRLEEEMRQAAKVQFPPAANGDAPENPESKLYRDHDELRHSFRSVLTHFRPYIRQFHLFTSDFPFTPDEYTSPPNLSSPVPIPNASHLRLGQLPSWLSTEEKGRWEDEKVALEVTYHSQVFERWEGTSFNSFGIETQVVNLPNVEHNIIYLNDDFYFTKDLKPADFWTPAYGTVIRLDIGFLISPNRADDNAQAGGEWGPLGTASWLLSNRFGLRPRPYVHHTPKALPMDLLGESGRMWPRDFERTVGHRFRGMRAPEVVSKAEEEEEKEGGGGGGEYDAYVTFLTSHLVVERGREALLWGWVVGRLGGLRGEWGMEERKKAWVEIGGRWGRGGVEGTEGKEGPQGAVEVRLKERETVRGERVRRMLEASGVEASEQTKYLFSSLDGYPYAYQDPEGQIIPPQFSGSSVGQSLCTIEYDACFGAEGEVRSAEEAFKRIAFEKIGCGDCVIHALRSNSGRLGLNAFLPSRNRYFPVSASFGSSSEIQDWESTLESESDARVAASSSTEREWCGLDPHLPFVPHWKEGNFSLANVLQKWGNVEEDNIKEDGEGINLRRWVIRLIERYKFVIGETHALFLMIENPEGARSMLGGIAEYEALVCVNDDVKEGFSETDKIIRQWQEKRWPKAARWER